MDGYSLIDPANMRLVRGGANGIIETSSCDLPSGDDTFIPTTNIEVGHIADQIPPHFEPYAPFYNANYAIGQTLSSNAYRLLLCDDILSWEHIPLDGDYDDVPGSDFVLDFEIRPAPIVTGITSDVGPLDALTSVDMTNITLTFNEPMADPIGDTESYDVTNPANYRLIGLGPDHTLQSDVCGDMGGDDFVIPVTGVVYDDVSFEATIEWASSPNLVFGTYIVVACPTLQDAQGTQLDGNNDFSPGDAYTTSFTLDVAQTGTDLYVNTTDEEVIGTCGVLHCSIREAILVANQFENVIVNIHLQPDAIYEFTTYHLDHDPDGFPIYDLALPQISADVVIKGNGATLQRSYAPGTPNFRFIYHNGNGLGDIGSDFTSLTVENLTFRNGLVWQSGGAITGREIYVNNCNFEDNIAQNGGAIFASRELVVDRSRFLHNAASDHLGPSRYVSYGGAISSRGISTWISNSIFEENYAEWSGGAIDIEDNIAILENNLFVRNEANFQGTALYMFHSDYSRIIQNTFVNNFTSVVPTDSVFAGTIVLDRTDSVEIIHNTIAVEGAYAISLFGSEAATLFGNIMAGDGALCFDNQSNDGTISNHSIGFNVSPSSACLNRNLTNGDVLAEPLLGQLRYTGGPTSILPLGVASPALDLIPISQCVLQKDQRGIDRPIDGDGDGIAACDAGAFESLKIRSAFSSDLSLSFVEPTLPPPDGGLFTVRAILHNDGPVAAENVAVIFGGERASLVRDAEFFTAGSGRWQPGDILPGTEVALDLVYRVDIEMKNSNITVFGEVERNLIPDVDSQLNNGDPSEDDYASLTLSVGCSVVPTLIEPGDVDGITSAIYAANDESCNPGPDAFSLSPDSTYLVYEYSFAEFDYPGTQYTAFPPVDSDIMIDGRGAILDFDPNRTEVNPLRFFLTLPSSHLTLKNMTLQNASGDTAQGIAIKSQGDLVLSRMTLIGNRSFNFSHIYHTIGSLLIQDSYFEENVGTLIMSDTALLTRIERSTFYSNYLVGNIISSRDSDLDVLNSTFVDNTDRVIFSSGSGTVRIDQSTFYGNGTALDNQSLKIVRNSIFGPNDWICKGPTESAINSEGYNVLLQDSVHNLPQDIVDCGFDQPTDLAVLDVRLLPLASYNGSTPVMRPAADSPAVDLIPPEFCFASVDQRLVARPFNGACDAGAVELALDESFGIPNAPQLVDVTANTIALELPVVPSSELSIQLERSNGSSNMTWQPIVTYTSGTTTHVDSGLICGQTYQYRVTYISDAGTFFSQPSTVLEVVTLPCERPITHTFGLYKNGQWLFYTLDGDQRYDARFNWGSQEPGWQAVVGDWNGDGISGIGLFKDGQWLLRSVDLSGNVTDIEFVFDDMLSGAVALAGDWNGDGIDTVGLFQSGVAYLRNDNSAGVADVVLSIGSTMTVPIVGDWNGDNVDTIGIYENAVFSLIAQNTQPVTIQTTFSFGPLNWQPLAGDWNDDGIDTIGIYNQGLWRMRNSNASGSVDVGFNYGNLEGGWQPIGNFDSSPGILNLLFAATVPTPRVPVIPGPSLSTPTDPDNQPPALDDVPIEPTPLTSVVPTLEITLTPELNASALPTAATVPSYIPEPTQIEVVPQITPASPTTTSE
ncbi:MAG: right-handed parallel beta-helix repeat-containing protein [Anaerolineae bacterium]|nr:right-handed parallel beta-helix repeat-containing protein [Anaerolineae bacterium]